MTADSKLDVPTMSDTSKSQYGADGDLQMLELPYAGQNLSMLVLLPKETDGLESLETKLTAANLEKWTASMSYKSVQLFLPKFTMTSELSLAETLKSMGMSAAFDPHGADFSGMDGKKDLSLSAVVHKALVDVNEEGTVAAAATGAVHKYATANSHAKHDPPAVFRADHPFVFLIRDVKTDSILFMGRLVSPPKSSE